MKKKIFNGLKAFTLAEILVTLVIIGVVAAITVPMLMNDTNDKQYVAGMQKARSTIGEAFRLMTINGEISDKLSDDSTLTTEYFVKNILPKYLKIAKICGTGEQAAKNCGFASVIKKANGSTITLSQLPMTWNSSTSDKVVDTETQTSGSSGTVSKFITKYSEYNTSYFIQTMDGFSLNLFFNPYCLHDDKEKPIYYDGWGISQLGIDVTCFNAVYDMNGAKGPNTVGKDIGFVGSFYNGYEVKSASVLPYNKEILSGDLNVVNNNYWLASSNYCKNIDNNFSYKLPDINELTLLYLNQKLLRDTLATNRWYWANNPQQPTYNHHNHYQHLHFGTGQRFWCNRTSSGGYFFCVHNNALK